MSPLLETPENQSDEIVRQHNNRREISVPKLTLTPNASPPIVSAKSFRRKAVAQWDYTGPDIHEGKPVLRFKAKDEISVISKKTIHEGWGWGELNGVEAYFPVNYCKITSPNLRLDANVTPRIKEMQDVLKVTIKQD